MMVMKDWRPLAIVVGVMVIIDALWNPIILTYAGLFPVAYQSQITPIAASIDAAAGIFKLATIIMFASWMYVTGRNLVAADIEYLEFSPASRIWWFAVPFLNLIKPYHGMRELWNASRNIHPIETNTPIIGIWWAVWLGSGFLGWILGFLAGASGRGLTGLYLLSAIALGRAAIAIILLHGITEGQRHLGGEGLSEVFA